MILYLFTMQLLQLVKKLLSEYQPQKVDLSEYPGFVRAAILCLLFPSTEGLSTLLTKRTDLVDTHKGQIAFPGGVVDKKDRDLIATALREANEEIGIEPKEVEIFGMLDEHPVPSRFIITPVVGYIREKTHTTPHSVEVAEVFDVPLSFFADTAHCWTEEREFRGQKRQVWFYSYKDRIIWGATAAIIRNLLSVLPPLV